MKSLMIAWAVLSMATVGVSQDDGRRDEPLRDRQSSESSNDEFSWAPWWRERGDCGPLSLFVLLKLQGKRVTVDDVKRLTPLSPEQGCSLADLHRASNKLGMGTEVRFVNPRDLGTVPRPFIVHGVSSIKQNLGHFAVVVDHDAKKGQYALIDPVFERCAWYPEASLLSGYSGYVLVPEAPIGQKPERWAAYSMVFVGATILSSWLWSTFRRRRLSAA